MHQQSHQSRWPLLTAWLTGLLAVVSGLVAVPAAPAAADATYLCTGYAGCKAAGYSHDGYASSSGTMYWRMYGGHNCTNYAAYRMVRSGMPNTRPWDGGGNASNWGVEMASITNATPMVGSIAWWKANVPGAGSSGHVAYVEQVVSATEIIVSEDSWGGDFHWKRITKSGRGWPSGFIHFNDKRLTSTGAPTISGTSQVGGLLTASAGSWTPAASAYGYQWTADGAAIAGATGSTYTPTVAVKGRTIGVRVSATRSGYVTGTAAATGAVVAPGAMANAAPPALAGTPQVDEVLQVQPGSWTPTPASTTFQWYADDVAIPGATGASLRLAQAQIDKRITVGVRAKTDGYRAATVRTVATEPVLAGTIEVAAPYAIEGAPRLGRTLTVRPGVVEPADATATYTWLRDGVPIAGATGPTYTLEADDVGDLVTVHVDLARRSYRSASTTVGLGRRVTTKSVVEATATGRPGRAVVVLTVTAEGVASPTGPVTVQVGGKKVESRVVAGRARVVVEGLARGTRAVRVEYAGTRVTAPDRYRTSVVIP